MLYNSILAKSNSNIIKLENELKSILVELGCDMSNSTNIMDYPNIIKTQLIHKDLYDKCKHVSTPLLANDLKNDHRISIQLNDGHVGNITLSELKKYFGIEYNYMPPYIDDNNHIILPNLSSGEYILKYEDENGNPLTNYEEIHI